MFRRNGAEELQVSATTANKHTHLIIIHIKCRTAPLKTGSTNTGGGKVVLTFEMDRAVTEQSFSEVEEVVLLQRFLEKNKHMIRRPGKLTPVSFTLHSTVDILKQHKHNRKRKTQRNHVISDRQVETDALPPPTLQ